MPRIPPSAVCAAALIAQLLLAAAHAAPALAQAPDPGRALYETRCVACHDRSVHRRESRSATDFAALRAEVARWNTNAGGEWRAEEIDQVTHYLNRRYYGHPCPPEVCPIAPRAAGGR